MASQGIALRSIFNGRLPEAEKPFENFCDVTLWKNGVMIKKYEHCWINYTNTPTKIDISGEEPVIEGCSPYDVEVYSPTTVALYVNFDDETYADEPWEMQIDNFVEEDGGDDIS